MKTLCHPHGSTTLKMREEEVELFNWRHPKIRMELELIIEPLSARLLKPDADEVGTVLTQGISHKIPPMPLSAEKSSAESEPRLTTTTPLKRFGTVASARLSLKFANANHHHQLRRRLLAETFVNDLSAFTGSSDRVRRHGAYHRTHQSTPHLERLTSIRLLRYLLDPKHHLARRKHFWCGGFSRHLNPLSDFPRSVN